MTRRALVTGSEGFAGRALCRHLAAQGWEVLGIDRQVPAPSADRRVCDLTDAAQVQAALEWAAGPTHVFHLAGLTYVPQAIEHPEAAMIANANATILLAQAIGRLCPAARLIHVSTSEVYGPPQRLPVDETHPLNPVNPYSISKLAGDLYCGYLAARGELDVVRARPFNHSGPGQAEPFVLASFARQVARIEAGLDEPVLRVGNLDSARDFSHVADVVRAYEALALRGRAGAVYNICSGRSVTIRQAMEKMVELTGVRVRVEIDPARHRPEVVPEIRGSHERLTADTGWRPEISFDQLMRDVLDDWRERVRG